MKNKLEELAMGFFFHGSKDITKTLEDIGLELLPDKTIADVKAAFILGISRGAGKFEREMDSCVVELMQVLQEKKIPPRKGLFAALGFNR